MISLISKGIFSYCLFPSLIIEYKNLYSYIFVFFIISLKKNKNKNIQQKLNKEDESRSEK